MQNLLLARQCDRKQPAVDEQQESEQHTGVRPVGGDRRDVAREEEREHRRGKSSALKNQIGAAGFRADRRLAGKYKSDDRNDWKQQENGCRQRQLRGRQKTERPAPLIDRGQHDGQRAQRGPPFTIRDPGEADVQQEQVGRKRNRPVIACREQRRRREPAKQSKHGNEQRIAAKRERHGDGGDEREQRERHTGGNEVPQRMRRKECREENRDAGGIERVGGGGITARNFQLARREQCQRHQHADDHAHRRFEPSALHRVAEKENRGDDERDAGNRRKQLDADQALPVERLDREWRPLGRRTSEPPEALWGRPLDGAARKEVSAPDWLAVAAVAGPWRCEAAAMATRAGRSTTLVRATGGAGRAYARTSWSCRSSPLTRR